MAYDIFISYRRRGGFETAKHLYDLLTKDGYRVSFDIDTLRNGDFDTELLRRIDECRDFILILSEGALDRCVDPSAVASADWVRCELAYALEKNKNIVPIMLAGFTAFPDNLPDDIRKVVRKNGPKYDSYYFDDFYRRLKSDFLETKPEERGDEDAYVTQLLKRLSVLKSVPEPTDGQQAELGETYYELGRLASLHNRPDMLDYLPQALAIFRRLAEKGARALPCADRRTGTAGAAEQTDVQALYGTVSPLRRRALRIAAGRSALLDRPGGGGAQLSAHGGGRRGAGRSLRPVRLPDPKKTDPNRDRTGKNAGRRAVRLFGCRTRGTVPRGPAAGGAFQPHAGGRCGRVCRCARGR